MNTNRCCQYNLILKCIAIVHASKCLQRCPLCCYIRKYISNFPVATNICKVSKETRIIGCCWPLIRSSSDFIKEWPNVIPSPLFIKKTTTKQKGRRKNNFCTHLLRTHSINQELLSSTPVCGCMKGDRVMMIMLKSET